ncbi:hypothetical protein BRDID11002_75530 [Bradyrhizobium diazoefficiens]
MSPAANPKRWALTGRIVTMATEGDVIKNGTIFIEDNRIAAILPKGQPAPVGFEAVAAVTTGGTIYPGLIELHNHLSYNVLPLWRVPQLFGNRDQWQNAKSYKTSVTGPMSAIALADDGSLLPALVRYVEAKCLVAGTTTSQGITLSNWSGTIHKYYKGAAARRRDREPARSSAGTLQDSRHRCRGLGEVRQRAEIVGVFPAPLKRGHRSQGA